MPVFSADGPRLAFRHDLIRQAVHENLPLAVRMALHREAADSLRGIGARSAEVAWHVVMSGGPVDDDAVTTLTTAVRELSSSAPDAAADLAQRVAGLLPAHDPRRITLLTDAAEYLGRTRRVHEALDLVDATLPEGLEPLQEANLRLVAAEIHQAAGDDAAAMTHLQQALDLPALPSDLRVRLLKTKATGHVYLGDITAAEQTGPWLVEASYRSHDPAVVVSAMVFQSQTSFYRGRLARALELAEEATRRAGTQSAALYLRPHGSRRCGWRPYSPPPTGSRTPSGFCGRDSAKRRRWAWAGHYPSGMPPVPAHSSNRERWTTRPWRPRPA